MNCNEARNRIAAYVDGELSTPDSSRLDGHVSGCQDCRRERSVQSFVSRELRRELTYFHASDSLRRRIRAAVKSKPAARGDAWWHRLGWAALTPAAGFASVALLSANVVFLATLPSKEDRLAEDVLASHVRALMSSHPIEVASSDQHTVKPWYAGRLDFSPPVTDFARDGFPLVGGRLDYVDGRNVAALVYQRGRHQVGVFVWPASNGASERPETLARRGYNMLHWTQSGMSYWMASDLEAPELARLEKLLTSHSP
jgi:anti-sigma factor RsiW